MCVYLLEFICQKYEKTVNKNTQIYIYTEIDKTLFVNQKVCASRVQENAVPPKKFQYENYSMYFLKKRKKDYGKSSGIVLQI